MNKLMVMVAVATSVFLAACSKSESELKTMKTPEEMAVALYEAVADGDKKRALKLIDSELFTSEHLTNWDAGFDKMHAAFSACGGLSKAEVDKANYSSENKNVQITTKLTFKGDCTEKLDRLRFTFHKDAWAVNLNPVQMSFEKHIGKY